MVSAALFGGWSLIPARGKLARQLALPRVVEETHLGQDQLAQHGPVGVHHPAAGAHTRVTVLFKAFQQQRKHLLI